MTAPTDRQGAEQGSEGLADWHDFLRIRHELIHRWIDEGKNAGEIVDILSMDTMQVVLISMTPLGPRQKDPRWTRDTKAKSTQRRRR